MHYVVNGLKNSDMGKECISLEHKQLEMPVFQSSLFRMKAGRYVFGRKKAWMAAYSSDFLSASHLQIFQNFLDFIYLYWIKQRTRFKGAK